MEWQKISQEEQDYLDLLMKKDEFHINKEGDATRGFRFSVSGKIGVSEYWRMGPFSTEDLAKDYIDLMMKVDQKIAHKNN